MDGSRLSLLELPREKPLDFCEERGRVGPRCDKFHFRSSASGEHHQSHNTLSVYLFVIFLNENIGFEFIRDPHNHRRRACVDSHLVLDYQLLG